MSEQPLVNLSCSFCGKSQNEVRKLIAGPKVCICDECIGLCNQIIGEAFSAIGSPSPTPESARGLMAGLVELRVARGREEGTDGAGGCIERPARRDALMGRWRVRVASCD